MQDGGFMSLKLDRSFLNSNHTDIEDIGELCRTPAPSVNHQLIVQNLLLSLHSALHNDFILLQRPIDLILNQREIRQPDIMLVAKKRASIIKQHAVLAPPNLVIEVQSPASESLDRIVKFKNYATFGIPEYWIIDEVNQTIERFRLEQSTFVLDEKIEDKNECLHIGTIKIPLYTIFNTLF